jgi:hypothetical protein
MCSYWWFDPLIVARYGSSMFYAIVTFQVLAGTMIIMGMCTVALSTPILWVWVLYRGLWSGSASHLIVPMCLSRFAITGSISVMFFIPVFAMMQWFSTDLGSRIQPYASYSMGPAFGCAVAALCIGLISTYVKGAVLVFTYKQETGLKDEGLEKQSSSKFDVATAERQGAEDAVAV